MTRRQRIRVAVVRGYLLLGMAAVWFAALVMQGIMYGDVKQIVTDRNDPRLASGSGFIYMEPETFERYYRTYTVLWNLFFWSAAIGIVLYLLHRRREGRTK